MDWTYGLVHAPPENIWHQHFNIGNVGARHVAVDFGSIRYPATAERIKQIDRRYTIRSDYQIDYEDEDPRIRETFEAEVARWREEHAP